MSLLLKALKQAERQNRESKVNKGDLEIDLPAQTPTASESSPSESEAPTRRAAQSATLSLSPDAASAPVAPPTEYPTLEIPQQRAESGLAFADEPELEPAHDQTTPEAFPRHAPAETDNPGSAPVESQPATGQIDDYAAARVEADPVASETALPSAPYLRAGEAGMAIAQAPGRSIRMLTLTIVGVAIGLAAWWTMTDHQNAKPLSYQPLPSPASTSVDPVGQFTQETGATVTAQEPQLTESRTETNTESRIATDTGAGSTSAGETARKPPSESADANAAQSMQPAKTESTPKAATPKPARTQPTPNEARITAGNLPTPPAVRFIRDTRPARSRQSLIDDGYRALLQGDLTRAKAAYQAALRQDRNLIDAWVGLASVAAHEGDRSLAIAHYQRALNLDPQDASARSGLIALHGNQAGEDGESALRSLLGSAENNPVALLALGSRLAAQGRWREAQQAYFKANIAQPNRPDTLFNLAVSLEQIRQPAAAIGFYERALELARTRPHQFDPTTARQRLNALRPGAEN